MEKLNREHDGFWRTPSGFAAVSLRIASGTTPEGDSYFEFKATALGDIIRVEWPKGAPLALLENTTAMVLVRQGYASHPTEAVVAEYHKLIGDEPTKPVAIPPAPTPEPELQTPAPTDTPAPAADQSSSGDEGGADTGATGDGKTPPPPPPPPSADPVAEANAKAKEAADKLAALQKKAK